MIITLISVPFEQDNYAQSMGRAPEALKAAGLVERLNASGVAVKAERTVPADLGTGDRLERLARLGVALSSQVEAAYSDGSLPVILGGDCLNAIGVSAGLQRVFGSRAFGIAWFDAHGDFNTPETTLSGYLPGMPLAAVCGRGLETLRSGAGLGLGVEEEHVLMLGVRDLDAPEKELLDSTPIQYLSPGEITPEHVLSLAKERFFPVEGVYLHLDIDALDPVEAPGVNYLTPGGLSLETTVSAARAIRQVSPLLAVTLAAINPEKDPAGRTVEAGIQLLAGILGPI